MHLIKAIFPSIVILCLLIFGVSGCATYYYGAAVVSSNPDGAQVYDMEDGSYIGVTNVKHVWRSKDTQYKFMNIRLQRDGYEDTVSSFWLNLDYSSAKKAAKNPQNLNFKLENPQ